MQIGSIDAIEFNLDNIKHIRVYYQTQDGFIRETSFETGNGWFVRTTNVIANNAKANSPITVTRWIVDNVVQIRVYYLNDARQICECEGQHNRDGNTVWRSAAPLQLNKATTVANDSSLAVARPDRDDATLRVFYQEARTNNKNLIREVKYRKAQNKWMLQNTSVSDALENSRFSAVSAGKTGTVRLYYQGTDNLLKVTLWDTDAGNWKPSKAVYDDYKLAPRAPIAAVAWYASEGFDTDDLRIRVYTVLDNSPSTVVEMARNAEDWDDPTDVASVQDAAANNSAIGACREKVSADGKPVFLFYKPVLSYIDVAYPPVQPDVSAAVQNSYRPRGIPVSLQ